MKELLWKIVAWVVSRDFIADWIIERSYKTPFTPLPGYMIRNWVFNRYDLPGKRRSFAEWLPSIRVHHILRADRGRHLHDHPWNARTIILKRGYTERRLIDGNEWYFDRRKGDTATLNYGEYHRIDYVPPDGVLTLFITWRYQGTWGFLVDGVKIPHREYQGERP